MTTAHLADQLQSLLHLMPTMSNQLQDLAQRQQSLEAKVAESQSSSLAPPTFGPPAKGSRPPASDNPCRGQSRGPPGLSCQSQGKALTMLVNHFIIRNLSRLQRRPWPVRRFVLQGVRKARETSGGAGSKHGCLYAGCCSERFPVHVPLAACSEVFGGIHAGAQGVPVFGLPREVWGVPAAARFGSINVLLAQIANLMLSGNYLRAMDRLALVLVAIEQAAQDAGKWEVAYTLSLFPDPPRTVFQSRGTPYNPGLRAWLGTVVPGSLGYRCTCLLKRSGSLLEGTKRTQAPLPQRQATMPERLRSGPGAPVSRRLRSRRSSEQPTPGSTCLCLAKPSGLNRSKPKFIS